MATLEEEFNRWLGGQRTHRGSFGPQELADRPTPSTQSKQVQEFLSGEWMALRSSWQTAARYDRVGRTLYVNFHGGGADIVHPISEEEAISYLKAPSHGVWYWNNVLVRGRGNQGKTQKKVIHK
jgi:hypothetical protein